MGSLPGTAWSAKGPQGMMPEHPASNMCRVLVQLKINQELEYGFLNFSEGRTYQSWIQGMFLSLVFHTACIFYFLVANDAIYTFQLVPKFSWKG